MRIRKSKKDRQHNVQMIMTKGQTTIYKTLHRKLKIEQTRTPLKPEVDAGAPEGSIVDEGPLFFKMQDISKIKNLLVFVSLECALAFII